MPPASVHRRVRRSLALVLAVLLAGRMRPRRRSHTNPATSAPADPAVVQTTAGAVRGVVAPDHRLFAGIPYAAPPVGPLRWQPPAPAPAWQGVRDATRPGPRCIQDRRRDLELGRQTDEDCLTLNVWTPPVDDETPPVMVWIHGGGFVNGSGRCLRRAPAGHRGATSSSSRSTTGSARWASWPIRRSARRVTSATTAWPTSRPRCAGCATTSPTSAAIPDKVTMAGESAGGMSVCDHLVAPGSAGLVPRGDHPERAVPGAVATCPPRRRPASTTRPKLGCGDRQSAAQCLRALPADKLRERRLVLPHRHATS